MDVSPGQGCSQQSQTFTQAEAGEPVVSLNPTHLVQDPVFSTCDCRVEGVNPGLFLFWTYSQEDQIWCLQKREFRSVLELTPRQALASVRPAASTEKAKQS